MTTLIADCETDGLLPEMTRLWMIQIGDASTDEVTVYADQPGYLPISAGAERLRAAEHVVFHNGISFDSHAINRFFPDLVNRKNLIDTLVLARLADPESRSHSLESWGERMGLLKGKYTGDFQSFTQELVDYSIQDIHVGRALYHKLKHVLTWGHSAQLEHDVAWAINAMERNGFALDVKAAEEMAASLREEQATVAAHLQTVFPPLERETVIIPKRPNKTRGYVSGVPFVKKRLEAFNPGSRAHCAERLMGLGWKPTQYGEDGVPKLDEKILGGMKHPLARELQRYFKVSKKLGMLADGKSGWLKLVGPDGRMHGRVNPNGARTGRMTHSKPNMAQVDKELRTVWKPRAGWKLVGVDGEGIQLRVLAHYLSRYDGGQLAKRLVEGKSDDRTDAHSQNLKAIVQAGALPREMWEEGFKKGRDAAKVCIYAKLFGSTDAGLGRGIIESCRKAGVPVPRVPFRELGRLVNVALARSMTGLDKLEEALETKIRATKQLVGIDGRVISTNQPRLGLVTLCQSGESVLMKEALRDFFHIRAPRCGWEHGVDYGLCAQVHDEIQIECRPEIAHSLGAMFADCIERAGETLNLKCLFAGKAQIGNDWHETH